jgi:hypothetical protein
MHRSWPGHRIVPESSVEEELRLGTLAALHVPALRATVPIALIRRRHGYLSGAAQRLKDDLAAWSVGRGSQRRGRR